MLLHGGQRVCGRDGSRGGGVDLEILVEGSPNGGSRPEIAPAKGREQKGRAGGGGGGKESRHLRPAAATSTWTSPVQCIYICEHPWVFLVSV